MLGKKVDFKVPNNGALHATLQLNTEQSVAAWQFVAYVYNPATPATSLGSAVCTLDAAEKTVTITMETTAISSLLAAGETTAKLEWQMLCRPNTTTGRRFFYGSFEIVEGGPAWAA